MTIRIRIALAIAVLVVGCSGVRLNARKPVEGTSAGVVSSPDSPEDEEVCTEVGRARCPYLESSFETVQDSCSRKVLAQAEAAEADYVHVNEPKQSIDGLATRSPAAIFYRCGNLVDDD